MGYLFGQKRREVGRLQRQAARCFLVTQEADSVELGTWCWPRVVLIEKRPLTECERSSMNRAARSAFRFGPYAARLAVTSEPRDCIDQSQDRESTRPRNSDKLLHSPTR
jgi:hypothetical protein